MIIPVYHRYGCSRNVESLCRLCIVFFNGKTLVAHAQHRENAGNTTTVPESLTTDAAMCRVLVFQVTFNGFVFGGATDENNKIVPIELHVEPIYVYRIVHS